MSTNQFIVDASTRHQVFLQRYGGGRSREARQALNRLRRDIMARLAQEPTEFQRARLSIVLADIEKLSADAFKTLGQKIQFDAYQLAQNEAQFSIKLYDKASGPSASFALPSEAALIAAVEGVPMTAPAGAKAITIGESIAAFGEAKAKEIEQVITDGLALGDTTPEISRRLSDKMSTLQRRQIDTLVRTAANHASSVARSTVYEENSDIIDGYKWVATLDGRTTMICASRDGKVYQTGTGPMPPAHWGCRSTTVPVVKSEFSLYGKTVTGERPAIGADGVEQVSTGKTFGGWLKDQPIEFQDEFFAGRFGKRSGDEAAALFRSGKLPLDKFVDPTGRVYTLEQLRGVDNAFSFAE